MRFGTIAEEGDIQIMLDHDGDGEQVEPTATFFPPQEPVEKYQAVTMKLLDDLLRKPQFARDFCLLLQAVYDKGRKDGAEESGCCIYLKYPRVTHEE